MKPAPMPWMGCGEGVPPEITGDAASLSDVTTARKAGLPVVVGSGITPQNAAAFAPHSDAVIVGSYLKRDGIWRNPVDPQRVRLLRDALDLAAS